jgi:hypothetical protein
VKEVGISGKAQKRCHPEKSEASFELWRERREAADCDWSDARQAVVS